MKACCTGITQNLTDQTESHTAKTMLSNSEFIILLNQGAADRERLAELLNVSEHELSYVEDTQAGRGVIKIGRLMVPFVNEFPEDTEMFRLMNTKVGK